MQQVTRRIVRSSEQLRQTASEPIREVYLACDLRQVPDDILFYAPGVEVLDLSNNQLQDLPAWIAQLQSLRVLFLSGNRFTVIPEVVGKLQSLWMLGMRANQIECIPESALPRSLAWLTLTSNFINRLPESLGALPRLRKLLLAGNQLSSLPASLAQASAIELIRISANRFESLPQWLFELPSLAWLAIAGNPCSKANCGAHDVQPAISWQQLSLGSELGRGASGSTFQGYYRHQDGAVEEVAVKVFTGSVSSDGEARDEVAATLAAGRHPNLVSVRAPVHDHPEGRSVLVLDLLPGKCRPLAKPPSFDSCTRDVYENDSEFSVNELFAYAQGIAAAAAQLHTRQIIHGDLYAHNILVHEAHAWLSDFGAACMYRGCSTLPSELLERIDVLAFGVLLTELYERSSVKKYDREPRISSNVLELASLCCCRDIRNRPSFIEIHEILSGETGEQM